MRTVEDVTNDLWEIYTRVHTMLDHWQKEMHEQFIAEMWNIYDLRQELIAITGSREESFRIIRDIHRSVFRSQQDTICHEKVVGTCHAERSEASEVTNRAAWSTQMLRSRSA